MDKKRLSLFSFFSLTASMIVTVFEYPTFATAQFHLVFFLLVCGIFWFLPVALCSAEMSTVEGWQKGGIFSWVSNTLGERFGFAAIFFQWFQITVGFVSMLYFIISGLAYVLNVPALDKNPVLKFVAVLLIFWGITFLQLGGTQKTAKIAKVGFIFGVIVPAAILFGLAIHYILAGNPVQIKMTPATLVPDFKDAANLGIFVTFILAFTGSEASASYVNELDNPKKNYPLAMVLLAIFVVLLNAVGGLSIAAVIPASDISLSSGVIQAFQTLIFQINPHLAWVVRIIAVLIILGVVADVSSWIVGPSQGMYAAAQHGLLPPAFRKTNQAGVPVPLVITQGIVVSIWLAILTFGGGGNNLSFLMAVTLTVIIYLVAYLLFFISFLVLTIKKSNLKRSFNVFGGKVGKILVATIGLLTSLVALRAAFIPPADIATGKEGLYQGVLGISLAVTIIIPFIIYELNDKSKHQTIHDFELLPSKEVNRYTHTRGRAQYRMHQEDQKSNEVKK